MGSKRVDASTVLEAGQWINKESIFRDAICGYARMVVKASGQRVYFTNRHGEDEGEYCAKKSVLFVSDTKDEADRLFAISEGQDQELRKASKEIRTAYSERIKDALSGKQ